ncbi:MAG: paraquat-inducible protein A [Sneathiella sp.]
MNWVIERILVGRPDRQTIAKYAKGSDRYLGVLLIVSAALLGLAMTQPMITTTGLSGLSGSHSLLTALPELLKGGQGGIAVLIAVITILLPILLLSTAFDLWYKYELADTKFLRKARLLQQLGRIWLLLLGLVLIAIYFAVLAEAETTLHLAVYYLVISLALQKLITARLQPMINAVRFVEGEEDTD